MTQLIASYELAIGCECTATLSTFGPPLRGLLFAWRKPVNILLIIITLTSGRITTIPFEDVTACMAAKNEIKNLMSENSVRVTCIIQK